MKKITLHLIGIDSWGRSVYEDMDGKLFKDTSLGVGIPALCTVYGGFEGEPDTPVSFISKYKGITFVLIDEIEESI